MLFGAHLTGGTADQPAIVNEVNNLYLRDVRCDGYGLLIRNAKGASVKAHPADEWHTGRPQALFADQPPTPLRLPVEETPQVAWEPDFGKWIKVDNSAGADVTAALQRAIDEGAKEGRTTVYFPRSGNYRISAPIRVHGAVRRIVGLSNTVDVTDPDERFKRGEALFTFEDLTSDVLVVENFFLLGGWDMPAYVQLFENRTDRTIVLRNFCHFRGITKKPQPGGRWFIEDLSPGRSSTLHVGKGEKVWARQFNPESPRTTMIDVDGGQLWLLGLKTEGRATHAIARNGAQLEILGGVSYQSWGGQPLDPPMFDIQDSDASITLGFYHHDTPFSVIVRETQGGVTSLLERKRMHQYFLPRYRACRGAKTPTAEGAALDPFIRPVGAQASSSQEKRPPTRLIDGSGSNWSARRRSREPTFGTTTRVDSGPPTACARSRCASRPTERTLRPWRRPPWRAPPAATTTPDSPSVSRYRSRLVSSKSAPPATTEETIPASRRCASSVRCPDGPLSASTPIRTWRPTCGTPSGGPGVQRCDSFSHRCNRSRTIPPSISPS